MRLTFATVKHDLDRHDISLRRTQDGELRVNYRNGREATAYYTDDLHDALATGRAMANTALIDAGVHAYEAIMAGEY